MAAAPQEDREPVLEARGISKRFGHVTALDASPRAQESSACSACRSSTTADVRSPLAR